MRPTRPHRFSASGDPSPYLREQARMQASTARACLRRLSDWVNSVRSSQAACLVLTSIITLGPPRARSATLVFSLLDPAAYPKAVLLVLIAKHFPKLGFL